MKRVQKGEKPETSLRECEHIQVQVEDPRHTLKRNNSNIFKPAQYIHLCSNLNIIHASKSVVRTIAIIMKVGMAVEIGMEMEMGRNVRIGKERGNVCSVSP